jgi:DNA-binding transcriptional LysR family regulator
MELRLLRYFVAVAETEHVGRAAQRLHVSQSPLSRQIHQLEQLLGVPLFAREGRRIRLTEAGRNLLPSARDLLSRADALVRDARLETRGGAPRIAIGFVGTALSSGVLPAALQALRVRHPSIEIALRHAASEAQLGLLQAGEIDVAFVHAAPVSKELRATRVLQLPYRLAVPRGAPLAKKPLDARSLGEVAWITLRSDERTRARWLAACASLGFVPRVAVEVTDQASALALVDAGMGVTALPLSQARSAPRGVVLRAFQRLGLTSELWAVQTARLAPLGEELVQLMRRGSPALRHRRPAAREAAP